MHKINRNLSEKVYRYKWQSLVNNVICEFNRCVKLSDDKIELKVCKHFPTLTLNYRDTFSFPLVLDQALPIFSNRSSLIGDIFYGPIDKPLPVNYFYTSTKYLREIKESGINCLIDK